jgi:murein DD-endopeptidase MepM/ murein hydrolase activator NlpD
VTRQSHAVVLVSLVALALAVADGPFAAGEIKPLRTERPFGLPLEGPPSPSTWLLVQPYGNTTLAYRTRRSFYGAGQGLHFGIDLSARCGTPVVAVGDGVVVEVDNLYHGAGPHNLMIDHSNGYASFYGHLLERPALRRGETVTRGQVVARTGDPDGTCTSRPHLHLEIRDAPSHATALNPAALVDADWESIAAIGASPLSFEQDLADPRRWQTLFDQPDVHFGNALLNEYDDAWPPPW